MRDADKLVNRKHAPEPWKMDNSALPVHLLWIEIVLYSGPRNSRTSRFLAILNDHVKIRPVAGIEVPSGPKDK